MDVIADVLRCKNCGLKFIVKDLNSYMELLKHGAEAHADFECEAVLQQIEKGVQPIKYEN